MDCLSKMEFIQKNSKNRLPGYLEILITGTEISLITSELTINESFIAPNGYLYASVIVALADSTAGYGCAANLPKNANGFTTIELKSNHLGTAKQGTLECIAQALHMGQTTQIWDAVVIHKETGEKLALFRCTQLMLYSICEHYSGTRSARNIEIS